MNLRNLKIRYRLGFSFTLILIITGMLGYIANNNINKIWRTTADMYMHPFTVSKAVRDIQTNIVAMHRSMKDVALAVDDRQIRQAETVVAQYERQVYKSFDIVFDRFLGNMADVQSAHDAFVNWKPIRDEVIELRRAGSVREAAAITVGKGAAHVILMNKKIQKMIDFANEMGDSFYQEAESVKSNTLNQSLVLLVSVVLVGIIVGTIVTRSIINPLKSMVRVSDRLKGGDLSARNTNISAEEETGILAGSINDLAESIQSKITVQKGVTKISETMIGLSSLKEFGYELLKLLMEISEANMGTFYILDERTNEFVPFTSIGANEELLTPFKAKEAEGEFGNAISNKNIYYLKDIPADTIFKFRTTAGDAIPREIITIPILIENIVTGLISLANIHNFSNDTHNILEQSWLNINSFYSGLISNERTQILAETLSSTNQKLEAQTEELQEQTEELQEQTEELQQTSDELQEQNTKLEIQQKEVENANRLKSEFLSNMSHELRTPLNSIMALSHVLVQQTSDRLNSKEVGYLKVVERNGKQLLELINDILDLSKIEAGQMEIIPSALQISDLIFDVVERIKPVAADKGIDLKLNLVKKIPKIISDKFLLNRIVQNIISNAVKFTDKGMVSITVEANKKQILVTVKDTGIGIPAENLVHIFDEFRQLDGSTARRYEGTGLGLAIAKRSVLLLGGDILVDSKENKGSKFTIVLPVKLPDTDNNIIKLTQNISNRNTSIATKGTKNKLLLVEDQEPIIIQLTAMLENIGLEIEVARNGQEAINYCKKSIPDSIVLDLMMPEMDGFQVLETIRSESETEKIPILILTAKDLTKNDMKRLSSNNIQQLVQKGNIDKDSLIKKIILMLESKREPTEKVIEEPGVSKSRKTKKRTATEDAIPTILIVEDNPDNLTSIKAALPAGYSTLEATDGEMGLKMIIKHKPDLVLMDIMLPKMDGITVLKQVQADKSLANIPIIAVTAKAMKADEEKIMKAGFDDYLPKPIIVNELIKKIKIYIK